MATDVKDLNLVKISDQKQYFIDANIWLLFLSPPTSLKQDEERYLEFFRKLLRLENKNIIVTSMLLSEIINRYLKDVSFSQYCKQKGISADGSCYKHNYRRSDQFKTDFNLICSDISIYFDKCTLCSDSFGESFSLNDIISKFNLSLDFNDTYYYLICTKNNYSIITNDSDFFVEDIEVITCNRSLIQRQRNSITPKTM